MTLSAELLSGVTLCLSDDIIPISETDMSPCVNQIHESERARLTVFLPLAQNTVSQMMFNENDT